MVSRRNRSQMRRPQRRCYRVCRRDQNRNPSSADIRRKYQARRRSHPSRQDARASGCNRRSSDTVRRSPQGTGTRPVSGRGHSLHRSTRRFRGNRCSRGTPRRSGPSRRTEWRCWPRNPRSSCRSGREVRPRTSRLRCKRALQSSHHPACSGRRPCRPRRDRRRCQQDRWRP